MTVIGDIPSVK